MMRNKAGVAALALALALTGAASALKAQGTPWIHVEVIEKGDGGDKVNVNLPLALAEVALEVMPKDVTEKVTSKFQEKGITLADLRKLWAELKNTGNAEFVTVESDDETVRVVREGPVIQVRVNDSKNDRDEQVQVDIPIEVVDALLSGEGEELNLPAAVQQLRNRRGDIVNVRDGENTVRVWIDART
jgi:hypothetical protein